VAAQVEAGDWEAAAQAEARGAAEDWAATVRAQDRAASAFVQIAAPR